MAVYKIHFSILEDGGGPVRPADTGVFVASMQAGLGIGDNATGTAFALDSASLGNTNALNMGTVAYYSPGATANNDGFFEMVMPSTEVPYVVVRDNACLVYEMQDKVAAATGDLTLSCLLYTSPSPRDGLLSRMPSSA